MIIAFREDFGFIFETLWKRLNGKTKKWRRIFKVNEKHLPQNYN